MVWLWFSNLLRQRGPPAIPITDISMVPMVDESIVADASASTPQPAAIASGSSQLTKTACSHATRPSPLLSLAERLAANYCNGADPHVIRWRGAGPNDRLSVRA